jgi:hypothetical protein
MAVTGNDTSKVRQTCSPLLYVNLLVVFFLMIFGMFVVLQILEDFLTKGSHKSCSHRSPSPHPNFGVGKDLGHQFWQEHAALFT